MLKLKNFLGMNSEMYFTTGILFFLFGAVISLMPFRKGRKYLYLFPAMGAFQLFISGVSLASGMQITMPSSAISSVFEFAFQGDALSGFFIAVISLIALSVSVYSIGYTKDLRNQALMGFLYNLFILSMYAVILSANIITFLISWETMSVVSYFLVTFDRDKESARAGLIYAVMTHIGTAFIIMLFLALYSHTGHMDFSGMRAASAGIPENLKTLIFIFSIIGFGTKAGIIPFHIWLPGAHPAAPSNISSLMSGVMIKTGIYGFIRISMDILGHGPEWWGISIIVIGAVSSVIGVLYALMEHDIKKLLAYHSIENIGIILLGIGSAMMFRSNGLYALSAIALIAGLYHTLNHAIFKGLLFLGAGSIMHAIHTKNMEEMGGLIKTMPYTGLCFLIGSVAICALPPLNGFVSEWLTYQALLLGFNAPSITSKIISPLGGAALALTGALAAACFVKAFGISFLGMPRSRHAQDARESSASMIAGMAILALFCLLAGIFPGTVITLIAPSALNLTGSQGDISYKGFLTISQSSSLSPAALFLSMTLTGVAAAIFVAAARGKRKTMYADSWDCGMPSLTSRMQYTATAFTKPIRVIFKRIYLPKRELHISYILKPLFVKSIQYSGEITPFFERYVYEPLTVFIHNAAAKAKMLQSGSLNLYLGYILITLMLLLMFGT
jgi:hydrogenase-4 component B